MLYRCKVCGKWSLSWWDLFWHIMTEHTIGELYKATKEKDLIRMINEAIEEVVWW